MVVDGAEPAGGSSGESWAWKENKGMLLLSTLPCRAPNPRASVCRPMLDRRQIWILVPEAWFLYVPYVPVRVPFLCSLNPRLCKVKANIKIKYYKIK